MGGQEGKEREKMEMRVCNHGSWVIEERKAGINVIKSKTPGTNLGGSVIASVGGGSGLDSVQVLIEFQHKCICSSQGRRVTRNSLLMFFDHALLHQTFVGWVSL